MFLDLDFKLYKKWGLVPNVLKESITKPFRVTPTITFVLVWKPKIVLSVGLAQLRHKKMY